MPFPDRDFAIGFTAAAALIMTHLSRLSEELILWVNPCFGFIDIADRFCTGSAIMPQKKILTYRNWCAARRAGKWQSGGVADSDEGPAAGIQQGQSGRQEPLFDTVDTLAQTLRIYADLMGGITVKRQRCALPHCRVTPLRPTWLIIW